jgi:hypothetical protein
MLGDHTHESVCVDTGVMHPQPCCQHREHTQILIDHAQLGGVDEGVLDVRVDVRMGREAQPDAHHVGGQPRRVRSRGSTVPNDRRTAIAKVA